MNRKEKRKIEEGKFLLFLNELEDYELVEDNFEYINIRQKVKIRHKTCGTVWEPAIRKFWSEGSRCPLLRCSKKDALEKIRKNERFDDFIKNSDYEIKENNFEYIGIKQRVKIRHKTCGTIWNPIIGNLLRKKTICPRCKHKKRQIPTIERLNFIFNNEKEYELVNKDFVYINSSQKIDIIHKKCDKVFSPTVHNFLDNNSRCPNCCFSYSLEQKSIFDFIKRYHDNVLENNRNIIPPYEIDIYVPEKQVAFEYNGLYWHSEERKGKNFHNIKTELCQEKGIKLFHIFSDEWHNKQEIVKSMILNLLNCTEKRIYARDCSIYSIDNQEGYEFFKKSHLSGKTAAIKTFCLKKDEEIVSCLSLRKPLKRNNELYIEIARFCSKLNTVVVGGFGKLMKEVKIWASENGYKYILSYADRRFGSGEVYLQNGFEYCGKTVVNYWYTNNIKRYSRQKYRAQNGKSEKQVAQENGVFKIYGCGSNIYERLI